MKNLMLGLALITSVSSYANTLKCNIDISSMVDSNADRSVEYEKSFDDFARLDFGMLNNMNVGVYAEVGAITIRAQKGVGLGRVDEDNYLSISATGVDDAILELKAFPNTYTIKCSLNK